MIDVNSNYIILTMVAILAIAGLLIINNSQQQTTTEAIVEKNSELQLADISSCNNPEALLQDNPFNGRSSYNGHMIDPSKCAIAQEGREYAAKGSESVYVDQDYLLEKGEFCQPGGMGGEFDCDIITPNTGAKVDCYSYYLQHMASMQAYLSGNAAVQTCQSPPELEMYGRQPQKPLQCVTKECTDGSCKMFNYPSTTVADMRCNTTSNREVMLRAKVSCFCSCDGELCGNNKIDDDYGNPDGSTGHEDCDGSDLGGVTCEDLQDELGNNYIGGELSCDKSCGFDTSLCQRDAYCGDGTVDNGEDGTKDNGEVCDPPGTQCDYWFKCYPDGGCAGGPVFCDMDCKCPWPK